MPPPPPPGAKKYNPAPPSSLPPRTMPQSHPEPLVKPVNTMPRTERKNCVYVLNIPKHFNELDKLTTFFKNEGQIKEIKVSPESSSAMVRFIKEEHAMRFVNSKKAIFNRGFITYSLSDKEKVDPELTKERENEEAGKVKKPVEVEMRQIKERMDCLLADRLRALLYLRKYLKAESPSKARIEQ